MAEYDGQGEDAGGSLVMAKPPWVGRLTAE